MKNPFRFSILPFFTMGAGGLGLALRLWLFSATDEKGLLPAGHAADYALYILTALTLGILFLATRELKPRRISKAFFRLSGTIAHLLGGLGLIIYAVHILVTGTARLGLVAVGDADGCLFCQADQPLLKQETVKALLLSAAQDPGSIWRPCFGENPGSPVWFPRWTFDQLMQLPEGKGGGYIVKAYPHRVRTIQVQDEYELMDADDRETLALLLQRADRP